MKKYYVSLVNNDGCNFDNAEFTNMKKAKSWACGRGQTHSFGKWFDYTVHITDSEGKKISYKTR